MKKILGLFCLLSVFHLTKAQEAQPLPAELAALRPVNIFPANSADSFVFRNNYKGDIPATFATNKAAVPTFTAEVFFATPGHNAIQTTWRPSAAVKKGDVLLARLSIHAVYAKQETGDAVVNFFFQQTVAPFERTLLLELNVGPEWKTINIPFVAAADMPAGQSATGLTFGALAQKVEFTNVEVFNFGKAATLAQMPATRFTYAGREPSAAWRTAALARIDSLRTAPLLITVKDAAGRPVKGATVTAELIDPAFLFGTAVSVSVLNGTDSNAAKYRRYLPQLFNAVTIDNNLKWPDWRDAKKRAATLQAVSWILQNNFHLRGHNLVWPGRKFSPAPFRNLPDFGPSFSDTIADHIKNIVLAMKDKVYGWDVLNEMVHEKDYFEVMPRTEAAKWFKLARANDPKATLFINEYSMLNNIASPQNIASYLAVIKELQGYGAPIDAVGVQGHVGRQPRSPAQVLTDLDLFRPLGLPVQITEFDVNTADEELQADYTRDFLIACYSHPLVNGFTMWGFWEAAHWKPDAAMFKKDWTIKPNLAAWQNLVAKEWRTQVSATSNAGGTVKSKGHLGGYRITVLAGGKKTEVDYQLTKKSQPLVVKLK